MWDCPKNADIPGTRADLIEQARDGVDEAPIFWLRGLPPAGWVTKAIEQGPTTNIEGEEVKETFVCDELDERGPFATLRF